MNQQEQINFLKELIQCKSITPDSEGPIDLIIKKLSEAGFTCEKLVFDDDKGNKVTNLYAHYGTGKTNFCFSGHVDVVPPGDLKLWQALPFEGKTIDEKIYGRGAVDMKGGLSSSIAAALHFIKTNPNKNYFKLSFLISGDEEWESTGGTKKLLNWLKENNHTIDACLVAEPTSQKKVGDTIKNGSRGSLLFDLTVKGTQGHVAYHKHTDNPITTLVHILDVLKRQELDDGTKFFEPSNLEVTNIEVNNEATNVIPSQTKAKFCIRFNDKHTQASLSKFVRSVISSYTENYLLVEELSGDAYKVDDERFIETIQKSVKEVLNIESTVSTDGATSDARFLKDFCPIVIELGPLADTAHKHNECVAIEDLLNLSKIYCRVIEKFFSGRVGQSASCLETQKEMVN